MITSQVSPPVTRDRFLDIVRAVAILGVVVQHWAMPVLDYSDGQLSTGNALATPGWWVVTWLSQVMPLVFFAGGAANLLSLRRAASPRDWLGARLRRLLLPVLPLFAVWLLVPRLLRDLGVPEQPVALAGSITAQLLWFLAVYLLTILATPLMVAAHRRWGLAVPVVLAGAAIVVDVARFTGPGLAGYANAVFVWLAVHQLGFHYTEGRLADISRRAALAMSAGGFAVTALLVVFGPYAASMIGMPGAPMSNMSPPTVCLISLAIGQIGLALAAKPVLNRIAQRPGVQSALGWVGPRFMSIYLWHMPALVVVSGVTVLALDYATPAPGSVLWLVALPVWLAFTGAVLTGLLRAFARFEAAPRPGAVTVGTWQLVVAGLLASAGLLGLAAKGFANGPELFVVLVIAAFLLSGKPIARDRKAVVSR
ncbi:acyltransferase [Saccharomonospora sp. NPDC046836]|uniref:acyltransferase family protein n=1 Tax=Saccharomonospora sp. NPDC046836 TaxID=3156921 RepID=UPI003401843E